MKTITIIHCFIFIYASCFSQVERYASLDSYAPLNAYLSTNYEVKLEKAIIKSPTTRLFVIDSIWGGISFRTEEVSNDFYFDVKIIETLNK